MKQSEQSKNVLRRGGRMMWLVVSTALLMACPPSKPGPAIPAASASADAGAKSEAPNLDPNGKATRIGSAKLVDRRHATALAADNLDQTAKSAPPPKSSTDIYKTVAPATVIIRVSGGLGSGVIVHPDGWVLTNHHVIAKGKADDFKHKATVLLGELSKTTGAMERSKKEYEAFVHKADKLRDIALLKINKPPKNLPFVKIAKNKPVPGNSVIALGHAGAGMLWALKSGEISALGKLADHLAQVASFKDDDEGKRARKSFKKYVESKNLGMVIQSTCNILPGDSGGPLVNDQAELIGLNVFSRRDRRTGGLVSFHVHHTEVENFAKDKPAEPAQLVPDPWLEGGGDISYEDADLDGKVDVLMMQGRKPCRFCPRQSAAAFIDIDQNSYVGRSKLPKLDEVYDKRDFEPEAVYLQLGRDVMIWYDTDNDGTFDTLLFDEYTTGMVNSAYTISDKGRLKSTETLSSGKPFRPVLFKDKTLHDRFTRITRAAFPSRYTDAPTNVKQTLPKPIAATGRARGTDLNRDGKLDAVNITTPFSKRLLVDADQSFSRRVGPFFNMASVTAATLDPEISVVSQGLHMWVFYDTDDDTKFDLALHAPGSRLYVAKEAWKIDSAGAKTSAPEHIGRKLIRPRLLSSKSHAEAVASMVTRGLLRIMSAKDDDGLSSFPHPVDDHRGSGAELVAIKGSPKSVIAILGQGSDGYLVDLDRNSRLSGPVDKIKVKKVLKDKKFDSEFAYFHRGGIAWAYYDADGRGGYDTVLVATKPATGQADAGFTIDKKTGTAKMDAALAGKPLVRPSLFKSYRLKKQLKKVAGDLFASSMIEK